LLQLGPSTCRPYPVFSLARLFVPTSFLSSVLRPPPPPPLFPYTTLFRSLIAGVLEPLSGRVQLDGFETSRLEARIRAQRIAMVQQESQLLYPMRAWEFVLQGRHPYQRGLRFETTTDIAIAQNALRQVGAGDLSDRLLQEISGGEKQRVILARALAQQPLLLLLDERTLHLDIGAQVDRLHGLRQLADANRCPVILVTHERNLAAGVTPAPDGTAFQSPQTPRTGRR